MVLQEPWADSGVTVDPATLSQGENWEYSVGQ